MRIEPDDLSRPEVHALLTEHLADMYATSPPESVHALDLERLRQPDISFWTVWDGDVLLGCGALRELAPTWGEVKSMRTARDQRRRGVGRMMLAHLVAEARARRYSRLSLETGTQQYFGAARAMYLQAGFVVTGPFGDYVEDPNSCYLTLAL